MATVWQPFLRRAPWVIWTSATERCGACRYQWQTGSGWV